MLVNKYFRFLFIVFVVSFRFLPIDAVIYEQKLIEKVLDYNTKDKRTWFLFDVDNTILETKESEIGGDQWFFGMLNYAAELKLPTQKALKILFPVYSCLQMTACLDFVEGQKTFDVLEKLHQENNKIFAVTAKGDVLINETVRRMDNLGVVFSCKDVTYASSLSRGEVIFYQGILSCCANNKGECLKLLLEWKKDSKPERIVFVDDKEKNVQDMEAALAAFPEIEFIGIRYAYLDAKVKAFVLDEESKKIFKNAIA